jgi:hypothetical protein
MLRRVVCYKFTDVSEVLAAFVISVISKKTAIFILAAMTASDLKIQFITNNRVPIKH